MMTAADLIFGRPRSFDSLLRRLELTLRLLFADLTDDPEPGPEFQDLGHLFPPGRG